MTASDTAFVGNDPASGANLKLPEVFANLDVKKNTLVIADTKGSVKYAGPAEGFLAPLILKDIAPKSSVTVDTKRRTTAIDKKKSVEKKPNRTKQTKEPEQQEEELNPQAEKVLEHAKGFLKMGRFTSYKKGIVLCRQLLDDYPDTKYEKQARELLKTVPERHRKRYKITNEELGIN